MENFEINKKTYIKRNSCRYTSNHTFVQKSLTDIRKKDVKQNSKHTDSYVERHTFTQ